MGIDSDISRSTECIYSEGHFRTLCLRRAVAHVWVTLSRERPARACEIFSGTKNAQSYCWVPYIHPLFLKYEHMKMDDTRANGPIMFEKEGRNVETHGFVCRDCHVVFKVACIRANAYAERAMRIAEICQSRGTPLYQLCSVGCS